MTRLFMGLSKVKIFSNIAAQAKKYTFKGTLVRQMLFQKKWSVSLQTSAL
jgi:hypothetical protein